MKNEKDEMLENLEKELNTLQAELSVLTHTLEKSYNTIKNRDLEISRLSLHLNYISGEYAKSLNLNYSDEKEGSDTETEDNLD